MVNYDREKKIIQSEAFRALNLYGRRLHNHAKGMEQMLIDCMERLVKNNSTYSDNISPVTEMERRICPDISPDSYTSRVHTKDLETIEYAIREYRSSLDAIQNLRSVKLRLLGDYDYTRGDDSDANEVFQNSLDNPEGTG